MNSSLTQHGYPVKRERAFGFEPGFSGYQAHANDSSDAEHMRMFGTAVAVNPRKGLKHAAEEEGRKAVRRRVGGGGLVTVVLPLVNINPNTEISLPRPRIHY